jgi:hypothetical protein
MLNSGLHRIVFLIKEHASLSKKLKKASAFSKLEKSALELCMVMCNAGNYLEVNCLFQCSVMSDVTGLRELFFFFFC